LNRGYFPSELPPSFGTRLYATALTANPASVPPGFSSPPQLAKLGSFSLARGNFRFRRHLALPNPLYFFGLSQCIVQNWGAISTLCASSPLSKSSPAVNPAHSREVSPQFKQRDLGRFRAASRAGCKAILVADVADFYPALYTHAIPWVFHTKATAKANRTPALFGNRIDQLIRGSQDGQTMGIPIGPDTSFIIAESVLAAVDIQLTNRMNPLRGLRWMDEFELSFDDRGKAEEALAAMQAILLQYELRLNPLKTKISDLPVEFEPEWIAEIRAFSIRTSPIGQASDLLRYFDYITRYLSDFPNEHVVKYGIGRLRDFQLDLANQGLFQSLICQAIAVEPGAIREALEAIYNAEIYRGMTVNSVLLRETVNRIITQNAPSGHDYEVSWCLWASISWGLSIDNSSATAISSMENSAVAILALDAQRRGLIPSGLSVAQWQARMTTNDLFEEQWLLAYEANVQGWLPSVTGPDHVSVEPNFRFIKQSGVRFYNHTSNPTLGAHPVYP